MTTQQDCSLGFAKESVYGTAVTPARFLEHTGDPKFAFAPTRVQGGADRAGSRVDRSTRRATTAVEASGLVRVRDPLQGLGLLWEAILGGATSTLVGGTTYQQVFTSPTSSTRTRTSRASSVTRRRWPRTPSRVAPWTRRRSYLRAGGIPKLAVDLDARGSTPRSPTRPVVRGRRLLPDLEGRGNHDGDGDRADDDGARVCPDRADGSPRWSRSRSPGTSGSRSSSATLGRSKVYAGKPTITRQDRRRVHRRLLPGCVPQRHGPVPGPHVHERGCARRASRLSRSSSRTSGSRVTGRPRTGTRSRLCRCRSLVLDAGVAAQPIWVVARTSDTAL